MQLSNSNNYIFFFLLIIGVCTFYACPPLSNGEGNGGNGDENPIDTLLVDQMNDPCFWCFDDKYYPTYKDLINCDKACPCDNLSISKRHSDSGVIILDNGLVIDSTDIPCFHLEEDSTLIISYIFYLEVPCDSLDCEQNYPLPTIINANVIYNDSILIGDEYVQNDTITACDYKPNRCSDAGTCITSIKTDFVIDPIDAGTLCDDEYYIEILINHEHSDSTSTDSLHTHIETIPIEICDCS